MPHSKFLKIIIIIFVTSSLILFLGRGKTWQLPSSSKVIAFSPNGEMLATGSGIPINYNFIHGVSSTVEIRRVSDGKIIQTLEFPFATSLAFSPNNNLIAAGNVGREIKIWRISDAQLVHSFTRAKINRARTTFIAFTPDGQALIASAGRYSRISDKPSQISVWELNSGYSRYTISKPYTCVAASPDGEILAFGGQIKPLALYKLKDSTQLKFINTKPSICNHLKFSMDNKTLVFQSYSGQTRDTHVYDVENGKLLRIIPTQNPYENKWYLSDIAISPDSKYLAASYKISRTSDFLFSFPNVLFDRIRIWNIEDGGLVTSFIGHGKGTNTIAFSPDSKWLASAGKNNTIRLWPMPPRNYIWVFLSITSGVILLMYSLINICSNWSKKNKI
ncbi:WD40 repeat-containing protein [Xenococcus sp. PCC 7305]|uniref:WD40 repeat domain-containing protein n=1 Tax=Xenococcus sp. PCC 7305 TaxID=102125 RepID=UPI0002ABBDC7|nr:hypothetical protein [Xenococcus sp. PCC 7305]ELS03107.1 WD40 repeat-containing protein [Xenococcus sp. PCC 7305]